MEEEDGHGRRTAASAMSYYSICLRSTLDLDDLVERAKQLVQPHILLGS